jgi:hypothetical protein
MSLAEDLTALTERGSLQIGHAYRGVVVLRFRRMSDGQADIDVIRETGYLEEAITALRQRVCGAEPRQSQQKLYEDTTKEEQAAARQELADRMDMSAAKTYGILKQPADACRLWHDNRCHNPIGCACNGCLLKTNDQGDIAP